MNINGLNNIQNFVVSQNVKTDKPLTNPIQNTDQTIEVPQKQMVNAQTALASYKIPKVNMSFKGSVEQSQKMSDEEFEKLKKEFYSSIPDNLSNEKKLELKYWNLNKININNAIKLVKNRELIQDKNFMEKAYYLIRLADTKEQADVLGRILSSEKYAIWNESSLNLIETLLKSVKLYDSENIIDHADDIVRSANVEQRAKIADKILSDKNLFCNKNVLEHAKDIISASYHKEQALITNKILSDKNLYENENVLKYAKDFITATSNYNFECINTILDDEKLYTNENCIKNAADIIKNYHGLTTESFLCALAATKTKQQDEIANKILSDKKLYKRLDVQNTIHMIMQYIKETKNIDLVNNIFNNEHLLKKINFIFYQSYNSDYSKDQIELSYKIYNNENLYKNQNVMNNATDIIREAQTEEQAKLANKIFDNKDLYENENVIYSAVYIIKEAQTEEQVKLANKIFDNKDLYANENFIYFASDIIKNAQTEEQVKLANKILDNKDLYANEHFIYNAANIIEAAQMEEQLKLINKVLDNRNLYKNIIHNALNIIEAAQTEEQVKLVNKILYNKDLYENEDVIYNAADIIKKTQTEEQAKLANKILDNKNLYKNEEVICNAADIIKEAQTEEQVKLANKILDNKDLYENEDVIYNAANIIREAKTEEQVKFVNKFLDNSKLYGNKILMKNAWKIIKNQANIKGDIEDNIEDYIDKVEALRAKFIANIDQFKIFYNFKFNTEQENINYLNDFIINENYTNYLINTHLFDEDLTLPQISLILKDKRQINCEDLIELNKKIGKENAVKLSEKDTITAINFVDIYNKQNINEIPSEERKELLNKLVKLKMTISDSIKEMFPILPKNADEYSTLISELIKSLEIGKNVQTVKHFDKKLNALGDTLANMSDKEFNRLEITQEYTKDKFIADTLEKVKNLPQEEQQKVFDYFGFEIKENQNTKTGYSITGYPVNMQFGETYNNKLEVIENEETKAVIEDLRENVIKFTKNNKIICSYPKLEQELNEIIKALPELKPTIGNIQHGTHQYDIFKHSLKVMQGIVKNPDYQKLNDSDKKIMLLASLLHDITKKEGMPDREHADKSSFDAYFIAKKFKLTQEEEIKLFTLIKTHEWLGFVNSANSQGERTKRQQSVAYDLRHDNMFDMALIFTHADLKGVNDFYADTKEGVGRTDFEGVTRSFSEAADFHGGEIRKYIEKLKTSQPLLPVTKLPSASTIASAITQVNADGSTNIKGVYKDKDGLIVLKYNELENEDLEKIGFEKGSTTKGTKAKTSTGENVDTGNIKFFVHGLEYPNQLAKFDAFNMINSDVLLSVSYAERPESKYRFFRPQGILLDCDTKYVHGGGNTDSGSGCGKFISDFKNRYIFGGNREKDRKYISDLIKDTLNLSDEEYVEFVKNNENKSMEEIEPEEVRNKLIKAFSEINSNTRKGSRQYNEMYISNPKQPMGVFAYEMDQSVDDVGNPVEFLNRKDVQERTEFLRKYALEHNIPFVVFGN